MTDTRTSAMNHARKRAGDLRDRCIRALMYSRPRTADDIADYLGESVLSIRPRITELRQEGIIVDTGERGVNASGRRAILWRLA